MKIKGVLAVLFLSFFFTVNGQNAINAGSGDDLTSRVVFGGFVRGGLYTWTDSDDKLHVPTAFSDFGIKLETSGGNNFKAFTDLRFRYGSEFGKPVSNLDIREAWVQMNGSKWNVSAGQRIIKWGRGDFTSTEPKKMFPFYSKVYTDKTGVTFKTIEPDFTSADFRKYFSLIHNRLFE